MRARVSRKLPPALLRPAPTSTAPHIPPPTQNQSTTHHQQPQKDPRPLKECHRSSIRLPRERFLDPAYSGTPLPLRNIPVWLQLDGRLHGCSAREPARAELRSVVDPRTGKGCGEVHGKMRKLSADLLWRAVLRGFSRVRRRADGADGLLLIAERREGLDALRAAAAAAQQHGRQQQGGAQPPGQRAEGLKRRRSSLGGGGEGPHPLKLLKRAERTPATITGDSFWYSEVRWPVGGVDAVGLRLVVVMVPLTKVIAGNMQPGNPDAPSLPSLNHPPTHPPQSPTHPPGRQGAHPPHPQERMAPAPQVGAAGPPHQQPGSPKHRGQVQRSDCEADGAGQWR